MLRVSGSVAPPIMEADSAALLRDLAVFYKRGGADKDQVERWWMDHLTLRQRITATIGFSLMATKGREVPYPLLTICAELRRRQGERLR